MNHNDMKNKNIVCIDKCYMYKNTLSSHQRISVISDDMKKLRKSLLQTLEVFHKYSLDNNILYSLHGGSLMGYYWNKKMIPWDDDIDVIVRLQDIQLINKLWESGKPIKAKKYNRGYDNKLTRIIKLYDKKYEIMKNIPSGIKTLFKLRPIENDCYKNVPGGIDIIYCMITHDGYMIDSWTPTRPAPGPLPNDKPEKFPIVDFNGIKTRAILKKYGEPFLNTVYSPKWKIKYHPRIKYPNSSIN